MNLNLPPPLARYFNAERTDATDLLADIFTADAVVRDEGRAMRGLDAITAWKRDAKAKYQYSVEPIRVSQSASTVAVLVLLTGAFPGSPIELKYTFALAGDKIASLEIRP
jgi:hypothetical protein